MNDDPKATVEQECFDKHLLKDENGESKFHIVIGMKVVTNKVKLPPGVRCKACILQWKYRAGNNVGIGDDGVECKGKHLYQYSLTYSTYLYRHVCTYLFYDKKNHKSSLIKHNNKHFNQMKQKLNAASTS